MEFVLAPSAIFTYARALRVQFHFHKEQHRTSSGGIAPPRTVAARADTARILGDWVSGYAGGGED